MTETLYLGLLGLIAVERIFEILLSKRNLEWALAEGGREVGQGHFPVMPISTLGRRWNTRVVVLSGRPLVHHGPYRWMRHPNYLAVVVEIAAVPLIYGAWWTALAFSAGNLLVLRTRLRVEEAALRAADGAAGE